MRLHAILGILTAPHGAPILRCGHGYPPCGEGRCRESEGRELKEALDRFIQDRVSQQAGAYPPSSTTEEKEVIRRGAWHLSA